MEKKHKRNFIVNNPTIVELKESTPEYSILEFITYINDNNFGYSTRFLPSIVKQDKSTGRLAGDLRVWFEGLNDIKIQRMKVDDIGSARSDIEVIINYKYEQVTYQYVEKLTLIYEVNGEIKNRLIENGQWVIMHLGGLSTKMKLQGVKT